MDDEAGTRSAEPPSRPGRSDKGPTGATTNRVGVLQNYFGDEVAQRYDRDEAEMFDPAVVEPVVDLLVELAHGRPALELGIGTGRIAIPLAQRGVPVHGIDLSEEMVERLRAKPGAARIEVTIGDFATTRVGTKFSLAYLVFNTIENLLSQDAQLACFQNVAEHLEPGGYFVIEVAVPDLQRLPHGERFHVYTANEEHVGVDEYDVANQGLVSHHYYRTLDGSFEEIFTPLRYVWPSELDLMARVAGMSLYERWGGWKREPFTSASRKHVSVWQNPPQDRTSGGRV
jgi:SAM-dependent methyltransferase